LRITCRGDTTHTVVLAIRRRLSPGQFALSLPPFFLAR
jgi:hypothetical protein